VPDQRQQIAAALRDAFWAAFQQSSEDDPFCAYYDPDTDKVDGELPAGIFGKMADAIIGMVLTDQQEGVE
jgi:hypothetical protein